MGGKKKNNPEVFLSRLIFGRLLGCFGRWLSRIPGIEIVDYFFFHIAIGSVLSTWFDCGRASCDKNKPCVCLMRWVKAPVLSVCRRAGEAVISSHGFVLGELLLHAAASAERLFIPVGSFKDHFCFITSTKPW